jgi:hypothetical protein
MNAKAFIAGYMSKKAAGPTYPDPRKAVSSTGQNMMRLATPMKPVSWGLPGSKAKQDATQAAQAQPLEPQPVTSIPGYRLPATAPAVTPAATPAGVPVPGQHKTVVQDADAFMSDTTDAQPLAQTQQAEDDWTISPAKVQQHYMNRK